MSGKKKKNAKKKKEKVIYYDDNSTVFDMSNVRGGFRGGKRNGAQQNGAQQNGQKRREEPRKTSTAKEKWQTYVNAVKLMFPWMCVAIIVICVLYFVLVGFGRCTA